MAYPTSLDALRTDYTGTDQGDVVDHAGMHNTANGAINAIEAELGTDPSGTFASVKARLDGVDADSRWTNARTPLGHKASHATGGTDALTAADIGAATTAQGAKADTALQPAYAADTSSRTLTSADSVVAVDTTSGAVTLTLPAASSMTGKQLRIIKSAGTHQLTVQRAGSDTILPSNGTRTQTAFPSGATLGEMMLVSTGSAWYVVSGQASDETVGRREWEWALATAATATVATVGWVLDEAETGWRLCTVADTTVLGSPTFNTANPSATVYLRRDNTGVEFRLATVALNTFTTSYHRVLLLPPGFRPAAVSNPALGVLAPLSFAAVDVVTLASASPACGLYFTANSTDGLLTTTGWTASKTYLINGGFSAAPGTWPTSLPGTAA